jgi:hypothetical protein
VIVGGLAVAAVAFLLASQPTQAQSPGTPGLMRYDLRVREGTFGQSMRLVGNVAMLGGRVLMRHCLQPHPFAPMLCQLSADGESSPPLPMPPEPPGMGAVPGPWGGIPGPFPGVGSRMSPAGALDRLFTPPPGVPGWQMQASGSGTWMGYAAEGSFSYWQPLF